MAVEMKYGDYIKGGWEIVKANLVPSIVAVICAGIPLLGIQVLVNYMRMVKDAKASGKPIEIGGLFDFSNFVNHLIGLFVAGFVAMICCGLTAPLVYMMMPLMVDHPGQGWMDCLKGSLAFGKQNFVALLILGIVMGIVAQIGALACGVGMLITLPIALVGQWLAYLDHKAAVHAAAAEAGISLA